MRVDRVAPPPKPSIWDTVKQSMSTSYHSSGMDTSTVSPKYQVVIPKRVRDQFDLKPGQVLQVMSDEDRLVVPSITIFEVFQWILREHSEADAIQASAVMQRGQVVQLDPMTAVAAAHLSHAHYLPMADSVILTTARQHQARLNSMDADFQGLSDVEFVQKGA